MIKPKGDAEIVNKLAENFLPLSLKMNELNDTLCALRDNTAEKDELQVRFFVFWYQCLEACDSRVDCCWQVIMISFWLSFW